jgi:hypothetical protein
MERTPHYSSDKPIRGKSEDLLGRVKFAEQLSRDLQAWSGEDSLVVALYGAWGSGKTSLKNLILEANLRKRSRTLPLMEFNPWRLSGTGGIRTCFFREFRLALENSGSKKDVANRAKRLDAYAASLALLGSTLDLVGKSIPFFGFPGGPTVEAAAQGVKSIAGVTKQGSEALTSK